MGNGPGVYVVFYISWSSSSPQGALPTAWSPFASAAPSLSLHCSTFGMVAENWFFSFTISTLKYSMLCQMAAQGLTQPVKPQKYRTCHHLPWAGFRHSPSTSVDCRGIHFTNKSLYTFKIKFHLLELNFHTVFYSREYSSNIEQAVCWWFY